MLHRFTTPRWLGLHALLVVSLVFLGLVGYWQLDKALGQGDWQNYGYAVQWWLFGGFAVFLWAKLILDDLHPERVEERREKAEQELPQLAELAEVRPVAAPVEDDDPELAAYNRHLAELAERHSR